MPPPPLIGTYPTPAVRLGQRVHCNYRGKWCRVTSYTAAPIPWPRVQPLKQRGGSGLWVNATLERAVRTESDAALRHWFGLSPSAAHSLRVWAGVEWHDTTSGTRRAKKAAADPVAAVTRGAELPDEACDRRAENAKRLKLIEHAQAKRWPDGWTPEKDAMLGTLPDGEVAKQVGKSWPAVQARRVKLGIPPAH